MNTRFLGALQFLTVLPIRRPTVIPGQSAVFFPVVGALLGLLAGGIMQLAVRPLGTSIAALLALTLLISLSGGLHEDGLADCADALRAGRTRERMLAILKDSRIGAYGALALLLVTLIRWQALTRITEHYFVAVASVLALSRSSLVIVAASTPPVGEGLGASFSSTLARSSIILVAVQMIVAALLCGWRGIPILLVTAIVTFGSRAYFILRLQGINGDCLGATCMLVESANLLVLAWQPST